MKSITSALFATWCAFLSGMALSPARAAEMTFTTIDVAPWASLDPASQEPVGFFPAVVHEIERRTGFTIHLALHPFVRIDHDMESGEQDCTTIIWNDYRGQFVERGELVSTHIIGVIARKSVKLKVYDDLKPLRISVLRGLQLDPRFDADASLQKEFDADYVTGINKIVHGRLDAIVGALATIHYLAVHDGVDQFLGDTLYLGEVPLMLQCSKKSKNLPLMPEINKAIKSMQEDGTIERLKRENYFS